MNGQHRRRDGLDTLEEIMDSQSQGMKLRRTITGSKDEMLGELRAEQAQCADSARLARTQRQQQFWKGREDGLRYAIRFLEDWDIDG